MATTLPDPPRTALIDVRTGGLTREWTLFFDALRRAIVSGLDDAVGGRLDALEADSLFGGSSTASGAGSDYNDAAVRDRLDAIETELIWLGTDAAEAETVQVSTGDEELDAYSSPDSNAAIQRLTRDVAGAQLVAFMAPDPTAAIRLLQRAVRDLETAQALATDAAGAIAALAHRLETLETQGAWS
jgi:hypothetical protein